MNRPKWTPILYSYAMRTYLNKKCETDKFDFYAKDKVKIHKKKTSVQTMFAVWWHYQEQGSSNKDDVLLKRSSKDSVMRYFWKGGWLSGKQLRWSTNASRSSRNLSFSSLPVRRSATSLYIQLVSSIYYILIIM